MGAENYEQGTVPYLIFGLSHFLGSLVLLASKVLGSPKFWALLIFGLSWLSHLFGRLIFWVLSLIF